MGENLDELRRDIEQTRHALGDKVGRLEHRVEETATKTLNPAYYVRTRPWPTLGAFAVLGWFVGRALKPHRRHEVSVNGGPPILRNVVRSLLSGAASSIGVLLGDLVRDTVRQRRKRDLS